MPDAATKKSWAERDAEYAAERWRSILQNNSVEAQGHRLVTHGAHTGHAVQTVALCEDAIVAKALADALAVYRSTTTR